MSQGDPTVSETEPADDLMSVLDLEQIEADIFRGANESREGMGPRLFGGQVLGQALVAASRTVEDARPCHSLHAYFMRPGDPEVPVLYSVDRIRDGRSFTTRRIVAVQRGEAIFSMDASFQVEEKGLEHQIDMTDIPDPDSLEDDMTVARRLPKSAPISGWARRPRPFEMRSVYPLDSDSRDDHQNPVWIRFRKELRSTQENQFALAYASDMGLVSRCCRTETASPGTACRWPAWITRSGSTARSMRRTGWCTSRRPPAPMPPGASTAAAFTRGTAAWSARRCRKG